MTTAGHYDDDVLIEMAKEGGARTAVADAHLEACAECRDALRSFRDLTDALADASSWEEPTTEQQPREETLAALRAFADSFASDSARGEEAARELLAMPKADRLPSLRRTAEYRAAGVVRALLHAYERAIDTNPSEAVGMTELAVAISELLDESAYEPGLVSRLRGTACRDHSYALFSTGRHRDALAAAERAERHLEACPLADYDAARVGIVKALALRALERHADAAAAAARSAGIFTEYGDLSRLASARLAEVHVYFSGGEYERAHAVLTDLVERLRVSSDAETHARFLANLGYCCWKLGRIEESLRHHGAAAAIFQDLGLETDSVRTRWNVASVLMSEGRVVDAKPLFESVWRDFERLGMNSSAALVQLDLAEIALLAGDYATVESLCRAAMKSFEASGVSHTARALTALAYMREAAALRTATPKLLDHVRDYLRRLPENETLLFAPPME